VICRTCGIEIADKALICYRCGTATTEAKFTPVARRRFSSWLIADILVIVVLALAALGIDRMVAADAPHLASWILVAVAVVIVAVRAYLRRR
jgi:uncharacterized membrane protein YkvI